MSNQLQQIQKVQEIPSELLHLIRQAVLIRKTEEKSSTGNTIRCQLVEKNVDAT